MSSFEQASLGFTAMFRFQGGKAFFEGFTLETAASKQRRVTYRVLVNNPADGAFYTMKFMEEPLGQREIQKVLERHYHGSLMADEFAFEVFDAESHLLFATRFDAHSKVPAQAASAKNMIVMTFSWSFPLKDRSAVSLS